mmetsp:Transcript_18214/g.41505  ORF Transcript_18214/g.41505 Transcript_18214/m.41505 type:complete len:235 (+) Transcript_18214:78-782(+)
MTLVYITKARRCAISYAPKSVGNTRSVTTKCFYSAENVRDLSLAASNLKMCKSSSDLRREYSHSFSKATFSRRGNFRKGGTFPQLQTRNMFIQTATTPNPESVKFVPGHPVFVPEALTADNDEEGEYQEENAGYFVSRDESTYRDDVARSPLARRIFDEDPGVRAVYLGRDFVTVTKYVKASGRSRSRVFLVSSSGPCVCSIALSSEFSCGLLGCLGIVVGTAAVDFDRDHGPL